MLTPQMKKDIIEIIKSTWCGPGCRGTQSFKAAWALAKQRYPEYLRERSLGLSQVPEWVKKEFEPEPEQPKQQVLPVVELKSSPAQPLYLSPDQLNRLADLVAAKLSTMLKITVQEETVTKPVERIKLKKVLFIGLLDSQLAPLKKEFEGCFEIMGWKEESFSYLKDLAKSADYIIPTKFQAHSASGVCQHYKEKIKPLPTRSFGFRTAQDFLTQLYLEEK